MAQHDRYENDLLKQLIRIANSLEKIEKKIPDAHNIIFQENFLGGLAIGFNNNNKKDVLIESEEQ